MNKRTKRDRVAEAAYLYNTPPIIQYGGNIKGPPPWRDAGASARSRWLEEATNMIACVTRAGYLIIDEKEHNG